MRQTFDQLQKEYGEFADRTWPTYSDPKVLFAHLRKEIDELEEAVLQGKSPLSIACEVADCIMLFIHLAHQKQIPVQWAVEMKFDVCKKHLAQSIVEHDREAALNSGSIPKGFGCGCTTGKICFQHQKGE